MKNQTLITYEFKIISILWLIVSSKHIIHKMPSGCAIPRSPDGKTLLLATKAIFM
jgi:hypothetical protein